MDTLQGTPTRSERASGSFAMCKKMLAESDATIRELRLENKRLKDELTSLQQLSNYGMASRESEALIRLRKEVKQYKDVNEQLSLEIVKLKKQRK